MTSPCIWLLGSMRRIAVAVAMAVAIVGPQGILLVLADEGQNLISLGVVLVVLVGMWVVPIWHELGSPRMPRWLRDLAGTGRA